MKTAVIFGVTGQDGSYLAELLLEKGYWVYGVSRRSSTTNTQRINHIENERFRLVIGDVTDPAAVRSVLQDAIREFPNVPVEVYNLAAQSHVGVSFEQPTTTTQIDYVGCLNILEAIRTISKNGFRFYQASTSEMFGSQYDRDPGTMECFQNEDTAMEPNSPYGIAKLAAHHLCRVYRESYLIFACSGILFNHESPRRGDQFVTRKITKYIANQYHHRGRLGRFPKLKLGNLDARRDWGHAADYVSGMWLMLQQAKPDDYVLATGETYSVRDFVTTAFAMVGLNSQQAIDWVEVDDSFKRPCEVPFLRGDASKARRELGWERTFSFLGLVSDMMKSDLKRVDCLESA